MSGGGRAAGAPSPAAQLAAFVAATTSAARDEVVPTALHQIVTILHATLVAVEAGGRVHATAGPAAGTGTGTGTSAWVLAAARMSRPTTMPLPDGSVTHLLVADTDLGDGPAHLLVARAGRRAWRADERHLLHAMTDTLAVTCRAHRALAELHERTSLHTKLSRIQRSIRRRAPLPDVLQAIVNGAGELFGDTIVALRRVVADAPEWAEVVCSAGLPDGSDLGRRIRVGAGAGGVAIAEDRLVVMNAYAADPQALPDFAAVGLQAAMAAPVHEDGRTIGSLVVASMVPGRAYSAVEQEMLLSFAEHASIALTDARTADTLRRALRAARHDAMHDVLTGLPNRALLRDRLMRASWRAERYATSLALVFVDLDGFKDVNDTLGHDAGDRLLVEVSRRFESAVRDRDTVARLGGDEFAVLLEEVADPRDVHEVADRLLDCLAEPVTIDGRDVSVAASIGIAMSSEDALDSRTLLRNADVAMYEAKRRGGGRHVVFAPTMHERTVRRMTIEQELRDAIAHDELELHYQPIVSLESGRVVTVEALVRWRHGLRGLVAPSEFIPIAEGSRLIRGLGEWVLNAACRDAARWPAGVRVAVNVSPRQVDATLLPIVLAALRESALPADRLKLEVTEGVAMTEAAETAAVMRELHETGVRLAIDDFGTGYSSLSRLTLLPVDVLKIDRSLVAGAGTPAGRALLAAIVGLCRGTGLTAVAEGVETGDQLDTLRTLGCAQAQGYLLGRPVPAAEVARLLVRPLIPAQRAPVAV